MIIVSACLAGYKCRYNGQSAHCPRVPSLVRYKKAIAVCPEILAGLSTPRTLVEKVNGKFIGKDGKDYTKAFIKGANQALKIAELAGCKKAILKSKSPSCGFGQIYDGTFTGGLKRGNGIFAEKLKKAGIKIESI